MAFIDNLKELSVSPNLLHRVVVAEEANARQGTQSAKTRSEVRGGGKKPYKQKKTGNARQGTIRAPHYAHGGMALAVKPRDYSKKVNRKERRLALLGAFAAKLNSGDMVIVDKIAFEAPKTKNALDLLKKHGLSEARRVLVVLPEHHEPTLRSFRNIEGVEVRTAPRRDGTGEAFGTRDLVVAHKVLVSKEAVAVLEATYSGEEAAPAPKKEKAPAKKAAPKAAADEPKPKKPRAKKEASE
ncbi:MAG: 50S ribosomal protein L4 [Fimbriimonadaceae bacterium]|nr:50S ribosomal protein L4 [Fimbriimonadaceae bacterium]QYK58919.1 MAG: 50S ribosomal protein L4 [Fimbriimonadaceae bacterium]